MNDSQCTPEAKATLKAPPTALKADGIAPDLVGDEHGPYPTVDGFARFGLAAELVGRLAQRGIVNPTDVQVSAIPLVMRRQNLIVQAKTGTGKTFAFGLPLLHLLSGSSNITARALVVTPTRELAVQVHRDLEQLGADLGLRVTAVYGGTDINAQTSTLRSGTDVVVGTPGRLLDMARQGVLRLHDVAHVVLDEADEMLNMGFLPDVTKLLSLTPNRSQTLLFSATMPVAIRLLARQFAPNPYFIQVSDDADDSAVVARVAQRIYRTHPLDKPEILARILQAEGRGPTIVFCRTKRWAQRLTEEMSERGFDPVALHGDLSQNARERALEQFRSGKYSVLVATDVAARGIDIDGITHVVNYDAPEDAASYLHRIGRTARAGRDGIAVSLIDVEHAPRWTFIARELDIDAEPVETFSTSLHLYQQLDIPAGTKGRLVPANTARQPRGGERNTSGRNTSGRGHRGDARSEGRNRDSHHRNGGQRSDTQRRRVRTHTSVNSSTTQTTATQNTSTEAASIKKQNVAHIDPNKGHGKGDVGNEGVSRTNNAPNDRTPKTRRRVRRRGGTHD